MFGPLKDPQMLTDKHSTRQNGLLTSGPWKNDLLNKMLQSVFCLGLVILGVLVDACCSSAHA